MLRLTEQQISEEILKVNNLIELLRERNDLGHAVKDQGLENVLEIMAEKLQLCMGEFISRAHDEYHAFEMNDSESVLETFEQAINKHYNIAD